MGRRGFPAAPDAAALPLLRSSRHRRRRGGALHAPSLRRWSRTCAASCCEPRERCATGGRISVGERVHGGRNQASRHRRLQGRADHRNAHQARPDRRQGGGPPDARKRQGDARRSGARGRRDRRDQGQGRRQGEPGRSAGDLRRSGAATAAMPAPTAAKPTPAGAAPAARGSANPRRRRRPPRPTSNATCWCSAPALAAIRPPSAPPISARTSCWSSAARRSAASASTSAAFPRRRCCMPPR